MEMSMKERIIDHTTKMFARNGVKSVRMDDIAAEMGISKRRIYEIFGDKKNLIMDCIGYFHEGLAEHIRKLTEGATNIIEEYLIMLDVWDRQVEMTYNIMNDLKKFYPKIHEKYVQEHREEGMKAIKDKLQKGIDDGYLLANINLDLSLTVMGYSIYGVIKRDELMPANISVRDAFKYVISYFIRGIATMKGIKLIDDYFAKNK